MGWINEQQAIEGKFADWTETYVKLPGRAFQEPNEAYIALFILNGEGTYATLGPPVDRRHAGVVAIQIFEKENKGEARLRELADMLEPLFTHANSRLPLSPTEWIDFQQPSLSPWSSQDGWQQRNLTVSYTRDDIK